MCSSPLRILSVSLFLLLFVDNLNPSLREDFLLIGAILCDVIWKLRNRSLFENAMLNFDGVVHITLFTCWI